MRQLMSRPARSVAAHGPMLNPNSRAAWSMSCGNAPCCSSNSI
ncbi:Uncharacterised protein [Bordetella pertussis]|nr:Uncharacterised protein [Bordetella pertussis]